MVRWGTVETENRIDTHPTDSYDTLASGLVGRELLEAVLALYVGVAGCRRGWFAVTLPGKAHLLWPARIWKWPRLSQ